MNGCCKKVSSSGEPTESNSPPPLTDRSCCQRPLELLFEHSTEVDCVCVWGGGKGGGQERKRQSKWVSVGACLRVHVLMCMCVYVLWKEEGLEKQRGRETD